MSEERTFTISSFYEFIKEKRLMAAKCIECGTIFLPPQPMCTQCFSTDLEWVELEGSGRLLTYSVINIAPEQFKSWVPYIVGIIEFDEGFRLPGIICHLDPEKIKIGMNLKIAFEPTESSQWPGWSRYFFKPR
jgi:uncharacterized OB-fold protein